MVQKPMNKLERVLAALELREPDRVPTFSMLFDAKPMNDTLGLPHPPAYRWLQNPQFARFVDRTIPLWNFLADPNRAGVLFFDNFLKADVKLGFDAGLGMYYRFEAKSHGEFYDAAGKKYKLCDDGFGGLYAMYAGGTIGTPEGWNAFEKIDIHDFARGAGKFFARLLRRWSDKITVVASVGSCLHQDITEGMGFTNFVKSYRRDPGFVKDIIAYKIELTVEAIRAAAKAGIKVLWLGDDLAFKSGPMISPADLERLFGDGYRSIARAAHDNGAKIVFHTCGNVLDLLELIADWGYDGVQALEPTAGVTLAEAKRRIGDRLCLSGNIDITHILVDADREEVFQAVKDAIRDAGPGGGFILSATNTHNSLNHHNLRWMVQATEKYGVYPLKV